MAENPNKFVAYTPGLGKALKALVKNPDCGRIPRAKTRPTRQQEILSFPKNQGDSYNGYFKVIQTAPDKLKIIDGFADDPETYSYAGDALINDSIINDIAAKEFTITGNCFIYLIVYLSSFGDTVANIEKFGTKQEYELGKSKTLISRIKFADGKITKFSQEIHGMITGFIDGNCE